MSDSSSNDLRKSRKVAKLVNDLNAPRWEFWTSKTAALEALAQIGREARPALQAIIGQLLNGKSAEVRGYAALALGSIFSEAGEVMASEGEESWAAIHEQMEKWATTCKNRNPPRDETVSVAVEALSHALDDSDKSVVLTSARMMSWFGPSAQQALPRIQRLAETPDDTLRFVAKAAIANICGDGRQLVDELCRVMLDEKCDPQKRNEAASAMLLLVWVDKSHATAELIKAAALLRPGVSDLAFAVLGSVLSSANKSRDINLVDATIHHALRALEMESIAQNAQGTLLYIGPFSVPAIRQHLRSTGDAGVQVRLAKVLEGLGPEAREALPELEMLRDKLRDKFADSDEYLSETIAKIQGKGGE